VTTSTGTPVAGAPLTNAAVDQMLSTQNPARK
jgi:hypothetical protein